MTFDPARAARRLLWRFLEGDRGNTRPQSDAQQQGGMHNFDLGRNSEIIFGRIVDSAGPVHCYKVIPERGGPPHTATMLAATSLSNMGARQLNTLQPGTNVWMIANWQSYNSLIIGVEPLPMTAANRSLIDSISSASRARVDRAEMQPLLMTDNGGVTDWTAGRPFDSTTVGEAGWITETGLRIFIDPFMAMMAVDECCGVWTFYHDQLLRLCGHNLQMLTAGHERDAFDDELEYSDFSGYTPYPWEQLGMLAREDPTLVKTPEEAQFDAPWYAELEPKVDDQLAWHRLLEFRGYLGQGYRRMIVAPPAPADDISPSEENINRLSVDRVFTGLFDEQLALTGRYSLRSAKGIMLVKSPLIPVPKRKRQPADPKGDTGENYKFSGVDGDGPDHKVKGELADPSSEPLLTSVAAVLDLQAYIFNWEGLHPFHYHDKDWFTPEESDLESVTDVPIPFDELSSKQFFEAPDPDMVTVDERYGPVKVYPNKSYFGLLDSGGVVIGDGFGGEIRMVGGSIEITAPGDIWLRSGRSILQWAGRDMNIRARNSMDFACSERDMRFKAEKNMQFLAGNDSETSERVGGILLESRSASQIFDFENKVGEDVTSGGIMMRAPNSQVIAWAKDVYLRTGGGKGDRAVLPGSIVLDADRGKQPVIMHASVVDQYVRTAVNHYFGPDGNIVAANSFSAVSNTLGRATCVAGGLQVTEALVVRDGISVTNGHIGTNEAESVDNLVGDLAGQSLNAGRGGLDDCKAFAQTTLPTRGRTSFKTQLEAPFYAPLRPGNDAVIGSAGFSFRNETQYLTAEGWRIFEDRWQQMARLGAINVPKWTEKSVTSGSDTTFPYPGQKYFTSELPLKTVDLSLVEPTGRAKDRDDDAWESPQYKDPVDNSLNDYAIIANA